MEIVEGTATIEDIEEFLNTVEQIERDHGLTVQAFDARYVVGREHLERAVTLTKRATARGEQIARDTGIEILLYAAGRRQINRALEMGVSEGECPVVAVVVDLERDRETETERAGADALEAQLTPADTLGVYDQQRVCEFFEISETERETTAGDLVDLVCERVVLLVVNR